MLEAHSLGGRDLKQQEFRTYRSASARDQRSSLGLGAGAAGSARGAGGRSGGGSGVALDISAAVSVRTDRQGGNQLGSDHCLCMRVCKDCPPEQSRR